MRMVLEASRKVRSRKIELLWKRCFRSARDELRESLFKHGACQENSVAAGVTAEPNIGPETRHRPLIGATGVWLP